MVSELIIHRMASDLIVPRMVSELIFLAIFCEFLRGSLAIHVNRLIGIPRIMFTLFVHNYAIILVSIELWSFYH